MSTKAINAEYTFHYSWPKKEIVIASSVALVGLATIALGFLALQAVVGHEVLAFHALGVIGLPGSWSMIFSGSIASCAGTCFLIGKIQKIFFLKQKMEELVKSNDKTIFAIFKHLEKEKVAKQGRYINDPTLGKYFCWEPNMDKSTDVAIMFVLHVKGAARKVEIFTTRRVDDEKEDNSHVGAKKFLLDLDDRGYFFIPAVIKNGQIAGYERRRRDASL